MMIDETTVKGRIIAAAMKLAAERPWRQVTLADIAEAAGASLADLRQHFSSKSGILAAFSREIDDQMLRSVPRRSPDQATRDALFEVIMGRFDQLAPYRIALRSIVGSASPDPVLLRSALASQHWMLEAAGVDTSRPGGGVRLAGLASVYASVMRTWLHDEDPGLARTMAALDRRLRSGERSLRMVDDLAGVAERIAGIFLAPCRRTRREAQPGPPPPEPTPIYPQSPGPAA